MAMDGAFPITFTPSPVTAPGSGPASVIQPETGFLEALTRSVDGVSTNSVSTAAKLSIPAEAAFISLSFSGAGPFGGTALSEPAIALSPVGAASLAAVLPGTPTPNSPSQAIVGDTTMAPGNQSLNPGKPQSEATTQDLNVAAISLDFDILRSMGDVTMVLTNADQAAATIEASDRAGPDLDAIAGEVVNLDALPEPSDPKSQMPTGETSKAEPLPPEVGLLSVPPEIILAAQKSQSLLLPAMAVSPYIFAVAAPHLSTPLRSVTPQDTLVKAAIKDMVGEALGLDHPDQAMPMPPDGQHRLNEFIALRLNSDAPSDVTALAVAVVPPLPLRIIAQHQGLQDSDVALVAGWPFEFGFAGSAAQPSALPGVTSRAPEAAPAPPMRQLAPIAIALAFTPGASNGFNLTLDPVELGRVEIRVQREADGHSVRIMAERPETLALLQRDRNELDRSLADAGLRVTSAGLEFSLGNSEAGRDAPRDEGARQIARGRVGTGTTESQAEPSPARVSHGLLDLNI